MRLKYVAALTFMLALACTPAQAQWFAGPLVGFSFGGSAFDDDPPAGIEGGAKLTVGGIFGWLGRDSAVGFEVDFGYVPDAVNFNDDFFDSEYRMTTFMVNGLFAPSYGLVRPYGSGGVGIIKTSVDDADDFFDFSDRDFGVNIGGGLMGEFSSSVGWRGDIRYFRALVDDQEDRLFGVGFGDLDFWRGVFVLTFHFGG